jgi:RecA-family ATPase
LTTLELSSRAPLLIDPFLAAGSVTLLFGPPSAGKTMLTATMASALVRGEPLWGVFPVQRCRVLIVQADMNSLLYQERLRSSAAFLTDDIKVLLTDAMPLDVCKIALSEPAFVAIRAFAPDVVFVDTLRKTHNFDENDSTAADRVYAAWRTLIPGAAFVFLHHSRKLPAQVTADTGVREAFRGTTAWAASADTVIMQRRVRRANNSDWMTRVYFVRTRSCQEPAAILLRLNETLMLEPVTETPLEKLLLSWIAANPRAKRPDAIKWLLAQTDEQGKPLCAQATAYRAWDRVVRGDKEKP